MDNVKLLDVIAVVDDLPDQGLRRGQVGTVVELLAPGIYEVEFCDDEGRTYAQASIQRNQLMVLRYEPQPAT